MVTIPDERGLPEWESEGGSLGINALADMTRTFAAPCRTRVKKPEDTAEGCRAMAEADHSRAAEMGGDRLRFRIERSADAWTARAELLERLEARRTAEAASHHRRTHHNIERQENG